jgi:hypothetical protein
MRIATGKVAPEGGESFRVTPEEEAGLLAALEESEGSLIDGATLLPELDGRS